VHGSNAAVSSRHWNSSRPDVPSAPSKTNAGSLSVESSSGPSTPAVVGACVSILTVAGRSMLRFFAASRAQQARLWTPSAVYWNTAVGLES
jgi:hypothetical protein